MTKPSSVLFRSLDPDMVGTATRSLRYTAYQPLPVLAGFRSKKS